MAFENTYPDRERFADDNKRISIVALIALVLLGLSAVFQLTGLVSNHWVDTVSERYGTAGYSGLWQVCSNLGVVKGDCRGFEWEDVQSSHWFRAVQALEVLGFLAGLVSLLFLCLYYFVADCHGERALKMVSFLLLIFSFLGVLSAGIVIAAHKGVQIAVLVTDASTSLSWSFGISIAGSILYLAAAIAVLIA